MLIHFFYQVNLSIQILRFAPKYIEQIDADYVETLFKDPVYNWHTLFWQLIELSVDIKCEGPGNKIAVGLMALQARLSPVSRVQSTRAESFVD